MVPSYVYGFRTLALTGGQEENPQEETTTREQLYLVLICRAKRDDKMRTVGLREEIRTKKHMPKKVVESRLY